MKTKIVAKDKVHLKFLIDCEIKLNSNNCDLNHIDISQIRDMNNVFRGSKFNGDISKWDVSNVTNMDSMFFESSFNGNISSWNVSNVINMQNMFAYSEFNGDISNWDVSNVENISVIFHKAKFKGDLSDWKPLRLNYMGGPFHDCSAPIPYWFNYKNQIERNKNIEVYQLNKELESTLKTTKNISKKIKI